LHGYELLCNSMVKPAEELVLKHNLSAWIDFRCADAALAENDDLSAVDVVWMNDYNWPTSVLHRMQRRLAANLIDGALVVSFKVGRGAWDLNASRVIPVVDSIVVPASWGVNIKVEIRRKSITG